MDHGASAQLIAHNNDDPTIRDVVEIPMNYERFHRIRGFRYRGFAR